MVARTHRTTGSPEAHAVTRLRWRGFTLLELLVVVSMITLLLTITVPAMSAARRISKRTLCGTNLHSIGQAIQAYLNLHNDTYPRIAAWPPVNPDNLPPLYRALAKEAGGSREVFRCPADKIIKEEDRIALRTEAYWQAESVGTSYEWQDIFNGLKLGRDRFTRSRDNGGLGLHPTAAPLVNDYDSFHGGKGTMGSLMFLYADFHVAPDKAKPIH